MKRLFAVLLTLSAAAAAQAIPLKSASYSIVASGGTARFINNGAMAATFEEVIAGGPSASTITVQGCMNDLTCDSAADTNASTATPVIRYVQFSKLYDIFLITASWTGGTNAAISGNITSVTAQAPIIGAVFNPSLPLTSAIFEGSTSGAATVQAAAATTSYATVLPAAAAGGLLLGVNSAGTVTEGFSGSFGAVSQTGKTAAINTATLCAATAGTACGQVGQYHVFFNFWGSGTACTTVTAGSVTFLLTWTDEAGTAHSAVPLAMFDQKSAGMAEQFSFNTALATEGAGGDFTFSTNGSVVQYATGYTGCTAGTGTYNLRATVVPLQP